MCLERLTVQHVRIIELAELNPASGLNLIIGANASGKTSLLEAIDLLSRGRSFRTRHLHRLLRRDTALLRVAGRIARGTEPLLALGIQKSHQGATTLRVGGRDAAQSELAAALPVQALHPESHRLIEGAPSERRSFLDWGVFHVEPRFLEIWRRYQRTLRQRNAALRAQAEPSQVIAWHEELAATAATIDDFRRDYCQAIMPRVQAYAGQLLGAGEIELGYRRGWPEDRTLDETLTDMLPRDRRQGHTQAGPQRADLEIRLNSRRATGEVSRGQQKLLAAVLRLAQMDLLLARTGRRGVFLVDDLPSELDQNHRDALLAALQRLRTQVFVTAIEPDRLDTEGWRERKLFHVKQGRVEEMV